MNRSAFATSVAAGTLILSAAVIPAQATPRPAPLDVVFCQGAITATVHSYQNTTFGIQARAAWNTDPNGWAFEKRIRTDRKGLATTKLDVHMSTMDYRLTHSGRVVFVAHTRYPIC